MFEMVLISFKMKRKRPFDHTGGICLATTLFPQVETNGRPVTGSNYLGMMLLLLLLPDDEEKKGCKVTATNAKQTCAVVTAPCKVVAG